MQGGAPPKHNIIKTNELVVGFRLKESKTQSPVDCSGAEEAHSNSPTLIPVSYYTILAAEPVVANANKNA